MDFLFLVATQQQLIRSIDNFHQTFKTFERRDGNVDNVARLLAKIGIPVYELGNFFSNS